MRLAQWIFVEWHCILPSACTSATWCCCFWRLSAWLAAWVWANNQLVSMYKVKTLCVRWSPCVRSVQSLLRYPRVQHAISAHSDLLLPVMIYLLNQGALLHALMSQWWLASLDTNNRRHSLNTKDFSRLPLFEWTGGSESYIEAVEDVAGGKRVGCSGCKWLSSAVHCQIWVNVIVIT